MPEITDKLEEKIDVNDLVEVFKKQNKIRRNSR